MLWSRARALFNWMKIKWTEDTALTRTHTHTHSHKSAQKVHISIAIFGSCVASFLFVLCQRIFLHRFFFPGKENECVMRVPMLDKHIYSLQSESLPLSKPINYLADFFPTFSSFISLSTRASSHPFRFFRFLDFAAVSRCVSVSRIVQSQNPLNFCAIKKRSKEECKKERTGNIRPDSFYNKTFQEITTFHLLWCSCWAHTKRKKQKEENFCP